MTARFEAGQVGRTGDGWAGDAEKCPSKVMGTARGRQQPAGHPVRGLRVPLGKRSLPREVGAGKQESGSGMGWGGRVVWSSTLTCFGAAEPPRLCGSQGRVLAALLQQARTRSPLLEYSTLKKPPTTRSPRTDGSSAGDFAEIYFLLIWQYVISSADNHLCACEVSAFGGSQNRRRYEPVGRGR